MRSTEQLRSIPCGGCGLRTERRGDLSTTDDGRTDCPLWRDIASRLLSGGAGDEGGDDVGGVAVERDAGAVVAHGGAGVGVAGGFLDVAQGTPASSAAVMNAWRSVCGPTRLVIPARRAMRRTIRPAA